MWKKHVFLVKYFRRSRGNKCENILQCMKYNTDVERIHVV